MKIPVVWLREYVPVPEAPAEMEAFADTLTMAGLEVEEILESPAGPTFYTKITPNRGDWTSVYGTAREASAALLLPLAPMPNAEPDLSPGQAAQFGSVTIEDAENCPRYAAKIIRGVKVGPSPQWMQDRLTAAGMRPVNNVVDVTNYVMLELGQPLHAFDLDTLPEGKIVVRQAREGETITTLDQVERQLTPGMLCICDISHPIAVAGVMGGGPTEVTERTTNILLESAHFDALSIRRTRKRLALATEASYRFERYVDPTLVPVAAERAARLLGELAGGEVVPGIIDVYPGRKPPRRVIARVERIRALLGVDVDRDTMIEGLERLGLSVERSSGALDVLVPSWRPDLTMEDDIAEEVGRIALGYENLPETIPPLRSGRGMDSAPGRFRDRVRETLTRAGLQDVLTHSLTAPASALTDEERGYQIKMRAPLSPDFSVLRTSLLPGLMQIASKAREAGIRDVAVFEIGPVYRKGFGDNNEPYSEPVHITGLLTGSAVGSSAWAVKPEVLPMDFYYAKGMVEELLAALGVKEPAFAPGTHPVLHPGRTATVSADGQTLGIIGELSEATVEPHDLPRRVYAFNLDGDALMRLWEASDTAARFVPLPRYPSVVRDVAPVFATSVPYEQIERTAREAAGPLLESLRLTDVYEGANLGEGRRSLTLRFTFRSSEGTLRDAEVEAALGSVRTALVEKLQADLRI